MYNQESSVGPSEGYGGTPPQPLTIHLTQAHNQGDMAVREVAGPLLESIGSQQHLQQDAPKEIQAQAKPLSGSKERPCLESSTIENALKAVMQKRNVEIVNALLKEHANAESIGYALIEAAKDERNVEIVNILLKAGAHQAYIDSAFVYSAAKKGNVEIVKLFLESDSEDDISEETIGQALVWAAEEKDGNMETVNILLKALLKRQDDNSKMYIGKAVVKAVKQGIYWFNVNEHDMSNFMEG